MLYGNRKPTGKGYDPEIISGHIPVLDGYRGLAVLLVMCYHYIPSFFFGWVGVDLFFVLSGFLITSILFKTTGRRGWLAIYLSRRFLRIIPVYYFALFFLLVVLPFVAPAVITSSFRELVQHQQWYWFFGINIFHALNGFPENITTVHFWSLACEMQFYLIWPFVIAIFRNSKQQLLIASIILILVSIFFRLAGDELYRFNPIYRYVLFPSRMDAFCFGTLLFLFVTSRMIVPKQAFFLLGGLILAAAIILSINQIRWHFTDSFVQKFGLTINGMFWFVVLSISMKYPNSFNSKIGNNRLLKKAGIYSYGMYVFHLPVAILLSRIPPFSYAREGSLMMLILQAIIAFIITMILSMASYHLFEKRMMLLKPRYNAVEN